MSNFSESDAGQAFIATANSRETSPRIMEAIASFARNEAEAEALWNGDGFGVICYPINIWERVTSNGVHDATEFCWGSAGRNWWDHIKDA